MKHKFLSVIFLISGLFCFSQVNNSRLDSLFKLSKKQKNMFLVKTLNDISWEFKNSQVDSSLFYAKRSLAVAKEIKNEESIASAYNSMASSFEASNDLDSAEIYHQKSLKLKFKINDTIGIADTYNNLGIIEDKKSHNDLALKYYFKALKIYEEHSNDFEKVPTVLVNIGIVYKKQKEYQKTLDYYEKALNIYKENNFKIGIAIITGNMGSVLLNTQDYEKSITYSEKAKQLYDTLGYTRYKPYMQVNIAIAKDSLKQYESARKDFLSAISDFKKDQNLFELSNAQVLLANNYTRNGEYGLARKELTEALQIIHENNFKEFKVKALKLLAKVDALTNNFENAYLNHQQYAMVKDSLYETEKIKTIYELETKYETAKKQKEILYQRADIAEKELNLNRKNTQLIGLGILAIVLSFLGYLLYNQQKLKNHQLKKEGELKEALVKIETQNRLQEQRLSISRDLHDNIGAQLTFIISSIENLQYGFKIKNEKLINKLSNIGAFTKDTIYELRDTIWAMNKGEITLEDLQTRISNFVTKADTYSNNMAFSFNVDESISKGLIFTSVKGMNIYRIVQEAINNAIKYSEAKTVSVHISKGNQGLEIEIKDNGKGFNLEVVSLGNGLNNMKKRALDIKGEISITSSENKGTSIILQL